MAKIVFGVLAVVAIIWGIGVYTNLPENFRPLGAVFLWVVYVQTLLTAAVLHLNLRKRGGNGTSSSGS
jgi:hypothetical protein